MGRGVWGQNHKRDQDLDDIVAATKVFIAIQLTKLRGKQQAISAHWHSKANQGRERSILSSVNPISSPSNYSLVISKNSN